MFTNLSTNPSTNLSTRHLTQAPISLTGAIAAIALLSGGWFEAAAAQSTSSMRSTIAASVEPVTAESPDFLTVADLESQPDDPIPGFAQLTAVSQLTDVRPTDWAFQALQSLVERYGCIVGYSDRTYRGNRALSRYEFAAGLNACLDQVQELLAAATTDFGRQEDLDVLKRLQEEFAAELATLRGRIETLDVRSATLEQQQFSTTTRLNGETIFATISVLGGDRANGQEADRIPTLSYRVRLNFDTSFNGRDLLRTRFQVGNVTPLGGTTPDGQGLGPLLTNEGRIEFDGDSGGRVGIGLLQYRLPLGPRTTLFVAGAGNGFVDVEASQQLNPYFDGGMVSLFGLRNPIYNYTFGAGLGFRHFFNEVVEVNLAYLVPDSTASSPLPKFGLFNGQYGALAQLILNLSSTSRIGFTYINAYAPFPASLKPEDPFTFGAVGSNLANSNFGVATSINAYGLSGTISFNPRLALSGWAGFANQRYVGKGDGKVLNWAVGFAFPDLGKKGHLGGVLVGVEPKLIDVSSSVNGGQSDRDTSFHIEGFYRVRVTDNVAVTPGLIWLTAPNHDARNDDVFIGVIRTVFYF